MITVVLAAAMVASLFIACGGGGGGGGGRTILGIATGTDDDTVTIFNANSLAVIASIPVSGSFPWEITMSDDGSKAYVLNRYSDNISIISMSQKAEIGTIGLSGSEPTGAVIASDGYLYVVHYGSPFLSKVLISDPSPIEAGTIAMTADTWTYWASIEETPDGNFLYVGTHNDAGTPALSKIDIAAQAETAFFTSGLPSGIRALEMGSGGRLFIGSSGQYEIPVWDTNTDSLMGTPIPLGVNEHINGFVMDGGDLFVATHVNWNGNNGAVSIVDPDLTWDEYDFSYDDDDSYDVALPFTFSFLGSDYDTVTNNSNGVIGMDGYYDYDVGVDNILGFTPNNEDLDSGTNIFNYSSRVSSDHAVFQWCSATNDDDGDTNDVTVVEVVMFDDGRVRFDYLFSMPEANAEVDTTTGNVLVPYPYGVGDGSAALVDLSTTYGSPFDMQRQSFMWNPASPNTMTPVSFTWEGTGATHLPLTGMPHGIAVTSSYIFIPLSYDRFNSTDTQVVEVYARNTMLPAGTIHVGTNPRAVAVQP